MQNKTNKSKTITNQKAGGGYAKYLVNKKVNFRKDVLLQHQLENNQKKI